MSISFGLARRVLRRISFLLGLAGRPHRVEKQTPTAALERRAADKHIAEAGVMQLSENFTLAELTTGAAFPHTLCAQRGRTEAELVCNLKSLALNVLEPIRKLNQDFIITSGFRTAGSGNSQHYLGEAVDIQFPGLTKAGAALRARDMLATLANYDQFIIEYHGKSGPVFHISYREGACRKQCLTTHDLKTYVAGLQPHETFARA